MFSEKAKKKFLFYRFITHLSVFCPAILSCKRLPRLLLPPVRNDIYRPCMSRIHRPEWPTIRHKKRDGQSHRLFRPSLFDSLRDSFVREARCD